MTVALGEIVTFHSGGTPARANPKFWEGDVPWVSPKDMKSARLTKSIEHLSESVFQSTSLRKLPAETVVVVVRGMILAHTVPIGVLGVEAAINQDIKALIPRRPLVAAYLAAMLQSQHSTILAQVTTAAHGTKKLDSRVLEGIQIPLPPMEEQRRIADILERAGAISAGHQRAAKLSDALLSALQHEAFAGRL